MSRRNAEARAPAAATRARRRLTASLGPADDGDDGGDSAARAGDAGLAGLLQHGAGTPGSQPFAYDGGAQPAVGAVDASAGVGTPTPAKFRWRTGLRVAVLLGIVSLLLGGWFWWDVAVSRPHVVPLSDVSSPEASVQPEGDAGAAAAAEEAGGTPAAGKTPGAASGGRIVVHVAGAVNRAGVVELPAGSRVHEAVAAAGGSGPGADLNRLNLAAVLTDGQKIHVPQVGDPVDAPGTESGETGSGSVSGPGSGEPGAEGAKIDLNSASVEELGALPRVGPVLAQRIVDWRKEHGRFSSVEELDAVDGVGPKMLETLLPLVRIS